MAMHPVHAEPNRAGFQRPGILHERCFHHARRAVRYSAGGESGRKGGGRVSSGEKKTDGGGWRFLHVCDFWASSKMQKAAAEESSAALPSPSGGYRTFRILCIEFTGIASFEGSHQRKGFAYNIPKKCCDYREGEI